MRTTVIQKTSKAETRFKGITDQAMRYALNDPRIATYAKNLQRIPMAYKELLKQQATK